MIMGKLCAFEYAVDTVDFLDKWHLSILAAHTLGRQTCSEFTILLDRFNTCEVSRWITPSSACIFAIHARAGGLRGHFLAYRKMDPS